jgi:hypothetical protein
MAFSVEAVCTEAVDSLLLRLLRARGYTTCNCASPFHASARQSSCEQAMAAVASANDMLKSFVRWFAEAARLSIDWENHLVIALSLGTHSPVK